MKTTDESVFCITPDELNIKEEEDKNNNLKIHFPDSDISVIKTKVESQKLI